MTKAHLVKKDISQPMNDLCEETYTTGLYHTTSTNTVKTVCFYCEYEKEWTRIKGLFPQLHLNTRNAPLLRTYTGSLNQPLGQVRLGLDQNNQHRNLNAFVPGTKSART